MDKPSTWICYGTIAYLAAAAYDWSFLEVLGFCVVFGFCIGIIDTVSKDVVGWYTRTRKESRS